MSIAPDLPPMLDAILRTARARFPDCDWTVVEEHIRKAWNAVAHDAPWEVVREPARLAWEGTPEP